MCEVDLTLRAHGFEVIEKIGEGGCSSVYHVKWTQYQNETFVVKVTPLNPGCHTDTFMNETYSLSRLQSSNIISMFKHFIVGSFEYIILEYCPSGSIFDYVRKNGPMQIDQFLHAARQILEAVGICHYCGFAHLDIKPENILRKSETQIKLSDFGLARKCEKDSKIKTAAGSKPYCSPERFAVNSFDPFKADIWACGATFYFMLTGNPPYDNQILGYMSQNPNYQPLLLPLNWDSELVEFLELILSNDYRQRPTAEKLLNHKIFRKIKPKESPIPKPPGFGIKSSYSSESVCKARTNKGNRIQNNLFRRVSLQVFQNVAITPSSDQNSNNPPV